MKLLSHERTENRVTTQMLNALAHYACLHADNRILEENFKVKGYFSNLNSIRLLDKVAREVCFVNFRRKGESTIFILFCISRHVHCLLRVLNHTSDAGI